MSSRSPSRDRFRSRSRSPANDDAARPRSRSPSRSRSRSPASPPPRRNGRYRSDSRSRSRSFSRSRSRSFSRSRSRSRGRGRDGRNASEGASSRSTKIVVERLTKTINEDHLYEIFGQFGRIKDLDLPINRSFGTNRGTAYILYDHEADAEAAISSMHEAQVDGASIHVSIVLPRRKLSPEPPTARRGANIDPRIPFSGPRGSGPGGPGGGRRRGNKSPSSRFGPRSDVYRPNSPRSQSPPPLPRGGNAGGRFRSRSRGSFSSRSRSRSPVGGKRGGGPGGPGNGNGNGNGNDAAPRRRSRSVDSFGGRSRDGGFRD